MCAAQPTQQRPAASNAASICRREHGGVRHVGGGDVVGQRPVYALRVLLGTAEAGFFPGMLLYFMAWFPSRERGRAVSRFMTAIPVASIVGGPISGALLRLSGVGSVAGRRWLFLLEGVPAVALGFVTLAYLAMAEERAEASGICAMASPTMPPEVLRDRLWSDSSYPHRTSCRWVTRLLAGRYLPG